MEEPLRTSKILLACAKKYRHTHAGLALVSPSCLLLFCELPICSSTFHLTKHCTTAVPHVLLPPPLPPLAGSHPPSISASDRGDDHRRRGGEDRPSSHHLWQKDDDNDDNNNGEDKDDDNGTVVLLPPAPTPWEQRPTAATTKMREGKCMPRTIPIV